MSEQDEVARLAVLLVDARAANDHLAAELVGLRAERDGEAEAAGVWSKRAVDAANEAQAWREDAERLATAMDDWHVHPQPSGWPCDACAALAAHRVLVDGPARKENPE